jgi:hypothetical protein
VSSDSISGSVLIRRVARGLMGADLTAVLMSANLGDEANTTATVRRQAADHTYGASRIPSVWLERRVLRSEITQIADRI